MRAAFAVRAWAAIAPGLQSQEQWLQWADAPVCPVGDTAVELPRVPAMARRRLGHLAKMAVSVADSVLPPEEGADIPVVWASRYGDADKALGLLRSQAQDEPLSPTAFGLSVHNAVGAQHSILRGMRANAVCVASSHCAPEAGIVEAVGLLSDAQAPAEVLLVCYDEPLRTDYAAFHDEPAAQYAWAVRLAPLQAGEAGFALHAVDGEGPAAEQGAPSGLPHSEVGVPSGLPHSEGGAPSGLPHGLDALHFLLQGERQSLVHGHATGQWMWERVHA
ncbi:beta-ketoacyl synthase chain length factor [Acidovorax sp.]|uniref:beta-ketoacyl synthase chain length factor n=1 Tax=Acidovorax sp. TaxID=1872122 RepID=UPI00391F8ECB